MRGAAGAGVARRASRAAIAASFVALGPGALADEAADPAHEARRLGYSIGYQVGADFRRQAVEIEPGWVARGVRDALEGAEPRLAPEQMRKILSELKHRTKAGERVP